MGITDKSGATHWDPVIRVVIAVNEKEARKFLEEQEKKFEAIMRKQMVGRPSAEVEKLITEVLAKVELTVQEYELKHGLVIWGEESWRLPSLVAPFFMWTRRERFRTLLTRL